MSTQTSAFDADDENTQQSQQVDNSEATTVGSEGAAVNMAMSPSMAPASGLEPQREVTEAAEAPKEDNLVTDLRHKATFPEGTFPFSGTTIELKHNHQTNYGLRDQLVITFPVQLPTGTVLLTQRYMTSKDKTSRFYALVTQMLGRPPAGLFSCGDLAGMSGMLEIVHNSNADGDTFDNVDKVWNCVRDAK